MSENYSVHFEGELEVRPGARFAIVTSRFNHLVVDKLLDGALHALKEHGVPKEDIYVARTPGAWETPLVCKRLATTGLYDAIIALGAVIKGETAHFEAIVQEAARGCSSVMLETGVPVVFGILTTYNLQQSLDRTSSARGNKGHEAALCAIEMSNLMHIMSTDK